jgi:transcriptional regulator with XRE-family HTH domain
MDAEDSETAELTPETGEPIVGEGDRQAAYDPKSYFDLPRREITINQIVAWNMAYWRRHAGLTQEQLGKLIGWSKNVVSAAERSWDSDRPRQFTADDMIALTDALEVPLPGLFLPPDNDGGDAFHVFKVRDDTGGERTMQDLVHWIVTDPGQDSDVMAVYRRRYAAAFRLYAGPEYAEQVAQGLRDATSEELAIDRAAQIRARAEDLAGAALEMRTIADALDGLAGREKDATRGEDRAQS